MNKIKLFEMFAGYGGASFALKKAGIEFETVGYSEIDKFAIECYNQNHYYQRELSYATMGCGCRPKHVHKNYGDATKINVADLPDFEHLMPMRDDLGNIQYHCDYMGNCPFQQENKVNTYCGFRDQYNRMTYKVFMERVGYLK